MAQYKLIELKPSYRNMRREDDSFVPPINHEDVVLAVPGGSSITLPAAIARLFAARDATIRTASRAPPSSLVEHPGNLRYRMMGLWPSMPRQHIAEQAVDCHDLHVFYALVALDDAYDGNKNKRAQRLLLADSRCPTGMKAVSFEFNESGKCKIRCESRSKETFGQSIIRYAELLTSTIPKKDAEAVSKIVDERLKAHRNSSNRSAKDIYKRLKAAIKLQAAVRGRAARKQTARNIQATAAAGEEALRRTPHWYSHGPQPRDEWMGYFRNAHQGHGRNMANWEYIVLLMLNISIQMILKFQLSQTPEPPPYPTPDAFDGIARDMVSESLSREYFWRSTQL